jgi:hypothetical protein
LFTFCRKSQSICRSSFAAHRLAEAIYASIVTTKRSAIATIASSTATDFCLLTERAQIHLNGAINGVNKQYEAEKFKMHQGFIAVLKVSVSFSIFRLYNNHRMSVF